MGLRVRCEVVPRRPVVQRDRNPMAVNEEGRTCLRVRHVERTRRAGIDCHADRGRRVVDVPAVVVIEMAAAHIGKAAVADAFVDPLIGLVCAAAMIATADDQQPDIPHTGHGCEAKICWDWCLEPRNGHAHKLRESIRNRVVAPRPQLVTGAIISKLCDI